MQVEQELHRAAGKTREVEDMKTRLQVDKQRLDIQLNQAKEGLPSFFPSKNEAP